ncbi:MAG: hypothetical protein A2284_15570 [Deltaproteobacteria bacterium RIFOXYA12_FULL_61_11]|nr:MAG: hypothetical protein A2284_15570 [Deltaproteobacteria bacterium RIFOXYA12_FULL_61_11]
MECEGLHNTYGLSDYESSSVPRWCKGCGDMSILSTVQRILRDDQTDPEKIVCVSGIGCSSRFPHYLRTFGFHSIHGRALPIATGIALQRPDLHVLVMSGDGDCFSIGGGHWLHAMRYNTNLTVCVFDNEIYALTKNQASPTSPEGTKSNTTPRGSYLKALNPLSVMMGITNISFLAQTATWLPSHMEQTIYRAWHHKGTGFVRILQYCPAYTGSLYGKGGKDYPLYFLQNPEGIAIDPAFSRMGETVVHDHRDIHAAQRVALSDKPAPIGLIYHDPSVPTYDEIRRQRADKIDRPTYLKRLEKLLDKYTI